MAHSKVMLELLGNMAGVKIGKTYTVPRGFTVNAMDLSLVRPAFCALPGFKVKVIGVDAVSGFIEVEGPGGQLGVVKPEGFPGARSF